MYEISKISFQKPQSRWNIPGQIYLFPYYLFSSIWRALQVTSWNAVSQICVLQYYLLSSLVENVTERALQVNIAAAEGS